MKNYIAYIKKCIANRPIYLTYEDMPDKLIMLLFVLTVLPTFHWTYGLSTLYGPYVDAMNEVGLFSWRGLLASFFMGGLALLVLFSGAVSRRTGGLLYERWFK